MTMRLLRFAALAGIGVALFGCQGTPLGNGSGCASVNPAATIIIGNSGGWLHQTPTGNVSGAVTVSTGQIVCFENTGTIRHVMQGDFNVSADSTWTATYDLESGFVRTVQFGAPSNYTYHCTLHTSETGEIDVR